LHAGHSVSGASLNFCSASSSWPQEAQRYSKIGISSWAQAAAGAQKLMKNNRKL
jgi:hypothetical protein